MSSWTPSGSYWIGSTPHPTPRVSTSRTELIHLAIAFGVLSFDLALVIGRLGIGPATFEPSVFLSALAIGAAASLTGFVAHEMAHKVSAQRHGFWAEFRMSPMGLLLSLVTAFVGFLFASPGATVVGGMGDAREWGRTSLAGPLLNLLEGLGFLGAAAGVFELTGSLSWYGVLILLALFNGWFAAFNLIPIGPLDGRKVLRWNRAIWVSSFALSATFTVYVYIVIAFVPRPL